MSTRLSATRPLAFTALRAMAQALSSAWDLDTSLDLIAQKTTEVMHVDSCTIYLLDSDRETLRLRATTGLAARALGRATLRVGEGMTGHAVARNRPVFALEAQTDPHFKHIDVAEETGFTSLLAVPLTIEDQPIGALNVQTMQAHPFTEEEIEVLALIGDMAAGALAKARLYDKQRRQIEELQALAQVSEAVTSPQYLDDILDVVTDMAARTMNAAVCSIFLQDESNDHLELRSAKRTTSPYQHRPPLPLGRGVIGEVARTGRSIYIRDVRDDPRYLGAALAREEGLVSLLSVPLSVRDRVIGVFNCYTNRPHKFSEAEQALFLTLANQTALAIENARLITNAAVVREMHHRIKNNLQTVAMLMQLQLAEADQLDAREVLTANINRVHSIAAVHEALSERHFSLVEVGAVLNQVVGMIAPMMSRPDQSIDVQVQGETMLLPARAATNLVLVVSELVQNALEHAFTGRTTGQVIVSHGYAGDELLLLVRDDGIGLPDDADWDDGLGLEIARTLVQEDLGGRLKFNRLPDGTEVSIRLPRAVERLH